MRALHTRPASLFRQHPSPLLEPDRLASLPLISLCSTRDIFARLKGHFKNQNVDQMVQGRPVLLLGSTSSFLDEWEACPVPRLPASHLTDTRQVSCPCCCFAAEVCPRPCR